jgi:hypothetical protein
MGRQTDLSCAFGVQVANEWSPTSFPLPKRMLVSKVERMLDRRLNYLGISEFTLKRLQPRSSQGGVLPGCSLAKSKFKKCRVCFAQDDIRCCT